MKVLLVIALSFCTYSAFSKDGSSGCGPGWYIAKDNSLISSSVRSTTNGILVPVVTIGMTVGTSNCSKHSIVKNQMEDLKFATENYYEIAAEASSGEGQFLSAYGELMGCRGDSLEGFKKELQRNFGSAFSMEANPQELVNETYKMIIKDQSLSSRCTSV